MSEEQKTSQETSQEEPKPLPRCFIAPTPEPTQEATEGVLYDLNDGLRVHIPKDAKRRYRVVIADESTGGIEYANDVKADDYIATKKKYAIPWKLIIYDADDLSKPLWERSLTLDGKPVMIVFPEGAVGDTVAWMSYVPKFHEDSQSVTYVAMPSWMRVLFEKQYPDLNWVTYDEAKDLEKTMYATYRLGLCFDDAELPNRMPVDFRKTGLHHAIGYQLGLEDYISDMPPKVDLSKPRQIKEKYVVIATKASSLCKMWINPSGWRLLIRWLKDKGYRVLCIDKDPEVGTGLMWQGMPYGAEDWTGDRPLQERIDIIKDADMFIGLSSGLSWLAWCCLPADRITMINTFTEPFNEFKCLHINNLHVCHGCWNSTALQFQHSEFAYCPLQEDQNLKLVCSKAVTADMVIARVAKALGIDV